MWTEIECGSWVRRSGGDVGIGHLPKLSPCRLPFEQLLAPSLRKFPEFHSADRAVHGRSPRIISCGGGRKQAVAMATVERFNGPSVGWRAALEEINLNPIPPS